MYVKYFRLKLKPSKRRSLCSINFFLKEYTNRWKKKTTPYCQRINEHNVRKWSQKNNLKKTFKSRAIEQVTLRDKNDKNLTLNGRLRRRHTTPTLLAGPAGAKMSPKGPNQDGPKTEVRVYCVTSPGAEPQGIRVRIPEPKRPTSPPQQQKVGDMRERCPSVPEKDLYRKSNSLERRERYPTLSGAEIKRGLMGTPVEFSRGRRNPMLDRKHRYPTLSGAELRRGFTIGKCPLEDGLDLSLAPWPGMRWACVRVLHLYCKVFDQFELFELIVR